MEVNIFPNNPIFYFAQGVILILIGICAYYLPKAGRVIGQLIASVCILVAVVFYISAVHQAIASPQLRIAPILIESRDVWVKHFLKPSVLGILVFVLSELRLRVLGNFTRGIAEEVMSFGIVFSITIGIGLICALLFVTGMRC